ncbi:MAG TPA: wax ester/triacylglycerol synthase family O-acyltransferase [Mycobacteriales bacterium]|jgi:WS/DGAT/MGAT family acyltransferase|nr:wax ester/triacylglycerol synthase family O-acyltransferase [Mycobacteriales bacterium]
MPPTSSMFLVPETRDQPMHVGGLQLFEPPEGAGPDYISGLYREAIAATEVAPLFRRRPHRGLSTLGQWAWADDGDIDLEHHIRHSALPRPGRVRELLALTSRLHGTLLDRHRPLWETHLIEGLDDGRFAVYSKTHHALMDGVSALRLLERSLSRDPAERLPLPFVSRPRAARSPRDGDGDGGENAVLHAAHAAAEAVGDIAGLTPRLLSIAARALREQAVALPGQAPRSMLNVPITGSRRFAADAWDLARIRAVGKAADATVNDVVLAMCAGALRDYLLAQDALPDAPLVAMTPVSLRGGDDEGEGNAVGAVLVSLGTDLADDEARLLAIRESTRQAKASLAGLSQLQVTALSAVVMTPLLLNLLGIARFVRPAFNLVISNVPGPADTLYWNGARLDGLYPLSIPLEGQALNITVTSYAGRMQFGLTGCRRTLPHMQRLLHGLDESLAALEKAFA